MSNTINNLAEEITNQEVLSTPNYIDWNCDCLTDYIIQTHHHYVIKAIPQILPMAQKVVEVHGAKHAELIIIQSLFQQLSNEMLLHMKKEELVLFPYIKKLAQAEFDGKGIDRPAFESIKTPISVMKTEHETVGIILNRLSQLSKDYTPPEDACHTFRDLFGELKEFQDDLHMHAHLEDNILFPKAIQMEQALLVS